MADARRRSDDVRTALRGDASVWYRTEVWPMNVSAIADWANAAAGSGARVVSLIPVSSHGGGVIALLEADHPHDAGGDR